LKRNLKTGVPRRPPEKFQPVIKPKIAKFMAKTRLFRR